MSERGDATRDRTVQARVTEEEQRAIRERAESARMSLSAYLVACALGERRDSPEGES